MIYRTSLTEEIKMPDLEIEFETGNCIMPSVEMPFFGLSPGHILPLEIKDDGFVWCSNLSWSREQLANEIQDGRWFFLVKEPE
jgi:hypothetical protein